MFFEYECGNCESTPCQCERSDEIDLSPELMNILQEKERVRQQEKLALEEKRMQEIYLPIIESYSIFTLNPEDESWDLYNDYISLDVARQNAKKVKYFNKDTKVFICNIVEEIK